MKFILSSGVCWRDKSSRVFLEIQTLRSVIFPEFPWPFVQKTAAQKQLPSNAEKSGQITCLMVMWLMMSAIVHAQQSVNNPSISINTHDAWCKKSMCLYRCLPQKSPTKKPHQCHRLQECQKRWVLGVLPSNWAPSKVPNNQCGTYKETLKGKVIFEAPSLFGWEIGNVVEIFQGMR